MAVAASVVRPGSRVLDLGAGTGLLAGFLASSVPGVHLTLLDAAPAMLDVAVTRLSSSPSSYEIVVADLLDPWPAGPFDAVVSALAIHHLSDADKRQLYGRAYEVLVPGGVFVNAEQVAGPTPAVERRYHEVWQAECLAAGATAEDLAGAAIRMAFDRPATVGEQCAWLEECGFADVDCYVKAWRFAVFGGVRPR